MTGPATPTVCDCGTVLLPVGAISLICDGDVEHSETACIGCPTREHDAALSALQHHRVEIDRMAKTAAERAAEARAEVERWQERADNLRLEAEGIDRTIRTLRGQA